MTTPSPGNFHQRCESPSPDIDTKSHQGIVGALNYASVASRPDVTCALSLLARKLTQPTEEHVQLATRLLRHLYHARHCRIQCKRSYTSQLPTVHAVADASFAMDSQTSKSRTGYITFYSNGPVAWYSKMQSLVTTSSTESEHVALSSTSKDVMFVKQSSEEMDQLSLGTTPLATDSAPAMRIAINASSSMRSRSIRIKFHNMRDSTENKTMQPCKTASADDIADPLTKPLNKQQTNKHCSKLFNVNCYITNKNHNNV
eukprot:CAMPEP_0167770324 /NCGR_PEP_ID=MMETSP0110_2-20121227/17859_1 /TAXON_ID=629695 /ORGANISM="Gymnochlora sp., Strain CCMP2014" /LENGTH=257 /DNA_ID=CAMNT_0007659495 /DNA_START=1012 /DNA_END=1785 /DNA_ORIENTATION=-